MIRDPKPPRRPRARREREDKYAVSSGVRHECAACGSVSTWRRPWRWFGSQEDIDTGRDIVKLCGDGCQEAYEAEHGKLVEGDPIVVKAALRPSAFVVHCPECERESEPVDWTEDASGAFLLDPVSLDGPFVRCECGVLIEPQPVVVAASPPALIRR